MAKKTSNASKNVMRYVVVGVLAKYGLLPLVKKGGARYGKSGRLDRAG